MCRGQNCFARLELKNIPLVFFEQSMSIFILQNNFIHQDFFHLETGIKIKLSNYQYSTVSFCSRRFFFLLQVFTTKLNESKQLPGIETSTKVPKTTYSWLCYQFFCSKNMKKLFLMNGQNRAQILDGIATLAKRSF